MGSFNDYLEAKLLDLVFSNTAYTIPSTLYVALYTVTPSDTGGGTEVIGGSYARVAVTNNSTNFPAASGTAPTTKHNGTAVTFTTATADWGTVTGMAILDASTSGNFLGWAALSVSKPIFNGDTATFNINGITITLD